MYYFKDYIMRLIHGIVSILAKLLFNRQEEVETPAVMEENCQKDDECPVVADFPREEIIRGLEDGMKAAEMEIPEYLGIQGNENGRRIELHPVK